MINLIGVGLFTHRQLYDPDDVFQLKETYSIQDLWNYFVLSKIGHRYSSNGVTDPKIIARQKEAILLQNPLDPEVEDLLLEKVDRYELDIFLHMIDQYAGDFPEISWGLFHQGKTLATIAQRGSFRKTEIGVEE